MTDLQDEIRQTAESRYQHRLHAVLLVAQGMDCRQVATLLGDSGARVETWVRQFETVGFAGLRDGATENGSSGFEAPLNP